MKYKANANIVEINRYAFTIEADSKEEAKSKLKTFLENNCPYPYQSDSENGVICTDREPSWETRETESIDINEQ